MDTTFNRTAGETILDQDLTREPMQTLGQEEEPIFSKYTLFPDDHFHRNFEFCIDPSTTSEINIHFCVYSITEPFFVEGLPTSGEETNIYGKVLPEYNVFYPCLKWVLDGENGLPKMKYECFVIPEGGEGDADADADDKSQQTIHFENEIHEHFLSLFDSECGFSIESLIKQGYKGFYHDVAMGDVYVFYDASPVYEYLREDKRWALVDELLSDKRLSQDVEVFKKHPFLTRVGDFQRPTLLYRVGESEEPEEHPILGCTAYYFTETPPENGDVAKYSCIQSRIMYDVKIDEDGQVYYMGDNVSEFKELFEMGVLMCSTLHFEENGKKIIAIKNASHIQQGNLRFFTRPAAPAGLL